MEISNQLYYLQMNIKATTKNVTNDFCINFRYVFVHAKTTLSVECHNMKHQGGILTKMAASVFHII